MRLRRNQKLINWLYDSQKYFIKLDKNKPLNEHFSDKNKKLLLEIGCGKGDFCIGKSMRHDNMNYLGLEKYDTPLAKAVKKTENLSLDNLLFSVFDATELDNETWYGNIYKIFLNFSDPWPKKRHTNKRLTSPNFLSIYKKLLIKNGVIEFKTDNVNLYKYTLNDVLLANPLEYHVIYYTDDLHSNLDLKVNSDNVMTEYEKKFTSLGCKINKIIFSFIYNNETTGLTPNDSRKQK